ncbi:MAG: DUF1499 domain-containing protein [Bdellovibrionota bacterium]|nr:DUF1499 domain-containing protein [Bdellovibrionota bacterium]
MKSTKLKIFILIFLAACSGKRPENLGLKNNQLSPCPDKPNCVSSYESSEEHKIAPFQLSGDRDKDLSTVKETIASNFENAKLIKEEENYLYYEFTSSLMRYVDDVEFYWTEGGKVHLRSASRLGHSDLGVNSERIETIRKNLQ